MPSFLLLAVSERIKLINFDPVSEVFREKSVGAVLYVSSIDWGISCDMLENKLCVGIPFAKQSLCHRLLLCL